MVARKSTLNLSPLLSTLRVKIPLPLWFSASYNFLALAEWYTKIVLRSNGVRGGKTGNSGKEGDIPKACNKESVLKCFKGGENI